MNEENKHKLDMKNLTPDQRDKLDAWHQGQNQLKALRDIADMTQEMIGLFDKQHETGEKSTTDMGALLVDMRDSLTSLKDKKSPELPDYAKPVVEAVSKLEKSLSASIKGLDLKPNISVDAPQVNVESSPIDLKGIEKLLKTDIPKAFQEAVKSMPKPDKPDHSPLLKAWEGISEQLVSIENATRMKPLPGSMIVSNTSSNPVPITGSITATVDTSGLATSTIQTDGTQKTQIVDAGGEAVTVTGGKLDVNATASLAGSALPIAGATTAVGVGIVDGSGNQITSFGGGTQYADGAVRGTATGTIAMGDDGTNVQSIHVDSSGDLQVDVLTMPTTAVTGTFYQATQPVSAASLPLPTGAATAASQQTDALTDTQLRATAVPVSSSTLATAAKQPVLGTAGTASADVITVQGKALMTPLLTDGSATTQPISGTVTANTGLTQPLTDTQLRATAVPVSGTVTANLSAVDNAVLDDIALDTEAIKTSLAGTLTVTGGGGGVEYTEGDVDITIVGGAIMVEDAANTLQPLQGDKTNGLDVDVTRSALPTGAATAAKQLADNHNVVVTSAPTTAVTGTFWQATQPVSGTVTANAGTNLNTSALATEAGNLASVKTNTDKIPSQGQALAAASTPVVLTAAQVTTLTPPAAITGFATAAKQDTLLTELQLKADLTETQPVSLATVPSHAVTNAGTFAVQSTTDTPTTIYNGKKTVTTAGTRVTLASSQAVKSVVIKALAANTGIIYVGDALVASTNGFALAAGETVGLDIANLATVNLDSSVNGESVTYCGTN